MTESSQIKRLQTNLEVEIRDLEDWIRPYQKLIEEKRRQVQELENERLEAEKQEFISENGVTKKKPKKEKPENEDSSSSKSEEHLMNKLMSNLKSMSEEAQEDFLKRHGLK